MAARYHGKVIGGDEDLEIHSHGSDSVMPLFLFDGTAVGNGFCFDCFVDKVFTQFVPGIT